MRISASVMAHPDRLWQVNQLLASLGRGVLDVPVAWDDEGPPRRDPERVWRTARKAWGYADPTADWHLLLQDDAVVAPDLLVALGAALRHVPDPAIVSLYIGTGRPLPQVWEALGREADDAGASWIVGPRSMWGVALAVPTRLIPEMIHYGDKQQGIPDDMRVGRWARRSKFEAWFPWPSLVDHAQEPSLLGHGPGRQARRFIDASALTWDPAGPVVRHGPVLR